MEPSGIGTLYLAFEALKKQLSEEGLFDDDRKLELPKYPQRVGVITSKSGAAVQDIFQVLERRAPFIEVVTVHLGKYYHEKIGRKIDFLKTDMQGAEALLVDTIVEILTENQNIIIVSELYPYGLNQLGGSAREYLDYFLSQGFEIAVFEGSRGLLNVSRKEALDRVTDKRFPEKYINVYFSRDVKFLQYRYSGTT